MHLTLLAIDWVLLIEKCVLIAIIIAMTVNVYIQRVRLRSGRG